ncbi:MAG: hypothetical protein J0M02_05715 [Planctomycetes bacterium]|nr:hypothetical protein [Planctomycetota bacterium]
MLRPLAALLLIMPLLAAGEAARGERVFVCAHSFMTFIANMLPPLAQAGGDGFSLAGHQMIGGSQVIQHWNLPGDKAKPSLQAGLVDTLILSPTVQLPDAGIDNYARLGCAANPKLRILVQASWPAFDDASSTDLEGFLARSRRFRNEDRNAATAASLQAMLDWQRTGWCSRLQQQVAALNRELGREALRIVPVNEAVFALRQRVLAGTAPGLAKQTDLFKDPIGHPTQALCALVAYCHYAALFGRSPEGLPPPVRLPSADLNPVLQRIAWDAVRPASAPSPASTGGQRTQR